MATLQETVYRPPLEHRSALLELSVGCSYGKCSFCRLSNGETPLQLVSSQMLAENLAELAAQGECATRMFLLGENAFAFKTRYLLDIFRFVRSYLPQVKEFAMYGRADDVARKTDAHLAELRAEGLETLYVGLESGSEEILAQCRKGESAVLIEAQLRRLDACGIRYGLSSILGLGGAARSHEHALATAAFYSRVRPASIRVMTLNPMPGTALEAAVREGRFTLCSAEEILREELLLLENIHYSDHCCRFVGNHVSNNVAILGNLPQDREAMLQTLREALDRDFPPSSSLHTDPAQW